MHSAKITKEAVKQDAAKLQSQRAPSLRQSEQPVNTETDLDMYYRD